MAKMSWVMAEMEGLRGVVEGVRIVGDGCECMEMEWGVSGMGKWR